MRFRTNSMNIVQVVQIILSVSIITHTVELVDLIVF
jgi:hypothetical protein